MEDAVTVADRVYARLEYLETRITRLASELENEIKPGQLMAIYSLIGDMKEDLMRLRFILIEK
ncbi:MAG: hypothetical protein F7C32_00680 [Desulfurococcales archaeon]|nr:hypothetical protein [Desulfurococcales archaeon]